MALLEQAPADVPTPVPDPGPRPGPSDGVVAVVMDFVGTTLPQFDQLLADLRQASHGGRATGSLFQWSRATPDGVRVTEVWQSADHFEAFLREDVRPHLSAAGLRDPEITTYDVHSYLTQGPAVEPADDPAPGRALGDG